MATYNKLDDDEEMLLPGGDVAQQPYLAQPQTQQPYSGMAAGPPAYPHQPYPHQPYPTTPGHEVPMGTMAGSGSYGHNTTVIINQPPTIVAGPRMWSSTMCSCCDDMGSCLLGTFCPLILSCQVSMEMEESACVPCCVPNWLNVLRTKMRAENNIEGTVMDDCCVTNCCAPCVLCQMARELKHIRRSYQPAQ